MIIDFVIIASKNFLYIKNSKIFVSLLYFSKSVHLNLTI